MVVIGFVIGVAVLGFVIGVAIGVAVIGVAVIGVVKFGFNIGG